MNGNALKVVSAKVDLELFEDLERVRSRLRVRTRNEFIVRALEFYVHSFDEAVGDQLYTILSDPELKARLLAEKGGRDGSEYAETLNKPTGTEGMTVPGSGPASGERGGARSGVDDGKP